MANHLQDRQVPGTLHLPLPTCLTLESEQGTFLFTKTGAKAFFLGHKSKQKVRTVVGKAMEIESYIVQFPNSLFLIGEKYQIL